VRKCLVSAAGCSGREGKGARVVLWLAAVCACGLGPLRALGQEGPEGVPQPVEAPAVLSDALGAVAAALAKGVEPGDGTALVLPARGSPLDGYAAALMPLYLQREGWRQVRLFNGLQLDLPRGRELPLRLPAHAVFALRNAAQAVFVTADTDEAGVGGELQAALYDPAEGQRLVQARVPFSLPPSYRFLLCEVGRAWEPSDKEWLELLDELFAPANEEGLDFAARLTLAGGLYLFRQGFWKQSAEALLELCQPSANGRFLRAVMALELGGEAQKAMDAVQTAIEKNPDSGPLYALRGWLLLHAGSPGDAFWLLEQGRVYDIAHEGYYWYGRALVALAGGEEQKAEKALIKASELLPGQAFAHSRLARFYWNKARLEEAVKFYRRATQAEGENARAWAELGMALDASGDLDGAVEAFRKAFLLDPTRLHVARQLSSLLERKREYGQALDVLRCAAEANPYDTDVLAAYGDAAARRWLVDVAKSAFGAAVERDERFAYGKVRLAQVLAMERNYEAAEKMLRQTLAAHPGYEPAVVALGQLLIEMGRAGEAITVLSGGVAEGSEQVSRKLALAMACMKDGRYEDAVRHAQIAVSSSPGPDSYSTLARIFMAFGDLEKAQIAANRALESGFKSARAHLVMARLQHARGEHEKALEHCLESLKVDPFLAEAFVFCGELYHKAEDYGRCAQMWKKALELDRWDAELHWRLAELLERRLADKAGAAFHYRRHIELGGARARLAARRLSRLEED